MDCERTRDWIWGTERAGDDPPDAVTAHLAGCPACSDELSARAAVGRDMRELRDELEAEPPPGLDDRVLAAASAAGEASITGRFPVSTDPLEAEEIPDHIADELADSIAEDFGEQFAAMTTGRLRVRRELEEAGLSAALQQPTPTPTAPVAAADPAPPRGWQPPRATPQWMLAAALVLGAALAIGFSVGRYTAPASEAPVTISTTSSGLLLSSRVRTHQVGLSSGAIAALSDGNTYLLAGPVGGPYEVVGVVGWGEVDEATLPTSARSEIVVAVGPAGGWSKGIELAMNDLQAEDIEILGRRALPSSGR